MNLFRRLFSMGGKNETRVNDDHLWSDYNSGPNVLNMSVKVNAETVIQIPEVYDCLKILSETVGSLPLQFYSHSAGDTRIKENDHPIAKLLRDQPNPHQDAYEFRSQMTWDLALHRNAFAEIRGGNRGLIEQLVRLDPMRVQLLKGRNGAYIYEFQDVTGNAHRILPENMFHLRAAPLSSDGLMGRSLIKDGHRTFARALALEDYSRRFFENDATPSGVITMPGKFATKEQAHEFREKWRNQFTGANRHNLAVLDMGGEYKVVNIPNDKAQFIETSKEVSLQLLRYFRMPPHKVGILDRATFSNIEEQSLSFVTDTLLPVLVSWEKAIKRQLINVPGLYVEHNVAGLLRGDIKTRYEAYAIGRNWGWLSVNDIRRLENKDPINNGDTYLQPLNMTPVGAGMSTSEALSFVTPKIVQALEDKRAMRD